MVEISSGSGNICGSGLLVYCLWELLQVSSAQLPVGRVVAGYQEQDAGEVVAFPVLYGLHLFFKRRKSA